MIKPTIKRVLVLPEKKEQSNSGILLVNEEKSGTIGRVVDIGDEVTLVKINDKVIFGKFTGDNVEFEGEEYKIIKEEELLGIFEE